MSLVRNVISWDEPAFAGSALCAYCTVSIRSKKGRAANRGARSRCRDRATCGCGPRQSISALPAGRLKPTRGRSLGRMSISQADESQIRAVVQQAERAYAAGQRAEADRSEE